MYQVIFLLSGCRIPAPPVLLRYGGNGNISTVIYMVIEHFREIHLCAGRRSE